MKYCGVITPFRGVRVYTQCAMGMPRSETALEELMCRVLGDLLEEGAVAKIADDLYCGGDDEAELVYNWKDFSLLWIGAILDFLHLKLLLHPNQQLFLGGSGLTAPYEPVHIEFLHCQVAHLLPP